MQRYIFRRLLLLIPILIGASLLIFGMVHILPGDPAIVVLTGGRGGEGTYTQEDLAAMRHKLGTDRPLYMQYFTWLGGLLRGDAGVSLYNDRPVFEQIVQRFPTSFELAILSAAFSVIIALPIGITSALRQDTWVDYVFRVITIGGIAMPSFWVGTLVIVGLAIHFKWTPPLGYASLTDDPITNLQQMVWPAVVLGYNFSAIVSRMTRSCMLEVLRQDYIRTAWAKGLAERMVIYRHALKNALLPIVTIVGVQVALLMGGTVIMETVFTLPGMGKALVDSIVFRDYTMVQTIVVFFVLIVALANLLVDVLYAWLDPRIRYA